MRVIELSPRCNNACIFCAQLGQAAAPIAHGSIEQLRAAVLPGEPIVFVGGEPTLEPDLPALIRAARDAGATLVVVQTNARRLAYGSYARAVASAGACALDVSLHGSSAAMHDYHTSVDGSFAQTLRGIRHARDLGLRAAVSCVVTRSNLRHLDEIAVVAARAGAEAVRYRSLRAAGRAIPNALRLNPAPEFVEEFLSRARDRASELGIEIVNEGGPTSYPFAAFVARAADQAQPPDWLVGREPVRVEIPRKARPGRDELDYRKREHRGGGDPRTGQGS